MLTRPIAVKRIAFEFEPTISADRPCCRSQRPATSSRAVQMTGGAADNQECVQRPGSVRWGWRSGFLDWLPVMEAVREKTSLLEPLTNSLQDQGRKESTRRASCSTHANGKTPRATDRAL